MTACRRPAVTGPRAPRPGDPCLADAQWYARAPVWPVLPVTLAGGLTAHGRPARGSVDPAVIAGWWAAWPGMPAALPTGDAFEVVDVPTAAGRDALRRLADPAPGRVRTGPVAVTEGGRMWLFAAPGAQAALPTLLDWLDWADVGLDVHVHGPDQQVLAPVRPGAANRAGMPRWLVGPERGDPLPSLDVLLDPLAHACHRHQLRSARRARADLGTTTAAAS